MMKETVRLILVCFAMTASGVSGVTLQEVLQKHTDALGGKDRLRNLRSYVIRADVNMGGMKGTSVTYYSAPGRYRTDVVLPFLSSSQGCDGDDCWITDDRGLTLSMGADMKEMTATQMALADWSYCDSATFDGSIVLVDSNVAVDSLLCYVISMTPRNGRPALLYIDRTTFLPAQFKLKTDVGTFYARFYDYRPVEGIVMPFRSTEMSDAGFVAGITTVTEVQVNLPLADSLFGRGTPPSDASMLPAGADSVVVPFELWRNHIYISALVNGKGPFRFIFDSGAGGTAIDRTLVTEMGVARLGASEARGVGGADSSEVYQIDTLEIAGIRIANLHGSTVNLSQLASLAGTRIDGIIGYDLLNRFAITVDYSSHTLVIYPSGTEPRPSWGEPCPLTVDLRLPYVDAIVNDTVPARFRVDTGSASTIDFHSPFVLSNSLLNATSTYRPVTSTGIGGAIEGKAGLSPVIDICGSRIDSLLVNYSSATAGLFAGSNTAGNIGAGVLKAFAITFDYGRETVHWRRIRSTSETASPDNMVGVELAKEGSKIVVRRVVAGRAADSFLAPDDVIEEIDGQRTVRKSVDEVNRMLTGRRGSDVRVTLVREGNVSEVDLLLDSLY